MEGDPSLPVVSPHTVWTWEVYCELSFLKHEIESIRENLAFHFAGERGREEVGGKSVCLNQLKITIRKRIKKKKIPTDLIFFKTMWLFKPATWLRGGEGGWLIIFEYYRLAMPGLAVFRAGVIAAREWIASLGSWKGVVEQRSSCDSDVGMCVSHGDSCLVIACLEQHLKTSRSVPTESWVCAADADTTSKEVLLLAQKKNEPWRFAVLQAN